RVGYASGAPEAMYHFQLFKQSANLHTSSLGQHIVASYLREATPKGFAAEIEKKCTLYRSNRDVMVEAAKTLLPPDTEFDIPHEGLFIWFRLPEYCNASDMVRQYSKELKVVLVPGPAFSTRGGCKSCMRASFSMVTHEKIQQGMERFAQMIAREKNG
ncbi:MAG: aminotransferase class I/II-fold pyridoxal phosphate-dependent enzyme, partial [Planctomycetota bacterium]